MRFWGASCVTPQTTLDNLKKESKRWLKELRADDAGARVRLQRAHTNAPAHPGLRDVQHALALEHGLPKWTALKKAIESLASASEAEQDEAAPALADVAKYEILADDIVAAYATANEAAMQRINEHYGRTSTVDDLRATVWRLVYKVRQAGGAAHAFGPAEAREMIAALPVSTIGPH